MNRHPLRHIAIVCILIVLPLIYYGWGFPFQKLSFMVEPGKIAERVYTADALRSGRLPLWNPYFDSGHPHAACLQPASWYPPNLCYLIFDSGTATNILALLHYAAAGIFTWLFMRAIGLSVPASIFSAISFMFCGYLTARLPFPDILDSSIWMPLVLYFTHRIVMGGGAGCIAGVALALCLQILAGHTEPAIYTITLSGAYVFYFGIAGQGMRAGWKPAAAFATAMCAGLALAAVQLLPLHEVSSLSVKRMIDYAEFTTWSFHPFLFVTMLFPYAFGSNAPGFYTGWYWGPWNYFETSCYTGILPLCLALCAWALLRRTDRQVRFWGAVAVAALFLALGRYNPLYRIVYYIPVYNMFRAPARHCMEFSFAIAVLAGLGLRHIMAARDARSHRMLMGIAIGLVLIMALSTGGIAVFKAFFTAGFAPVFEQMSAFSKGIVENINLSNNAFTVPIFLMLVTAAVLTLLRFRTCGRTVLAVLFALLFIDLFSCGSFYWRREKSESQMFDERRSFLAPVFQIMRAGGVSPDRYRVCSFLRAEEDMDDLGIVYERFGPFRSINGFGMMLSRDYAVMLGTDIWGATSDGLYRNNRVLSMLGARYIIARPGERELLQKVKGPDGRLVYHEVFNNGAVGLFENLAALPQAWCVGSVRPVKDFEGARNILWDSAPVIDLRREALVEDLNIRSGGGTGEARVTAYTPERISLDCVAAGGCFLVLSERYFPGWNAYLDGRGTQIYRTNGILRGIALPAGRHHVEFVYRPISFYRGASLSGAALIVLVAACGLSSLSGRRRRRHRH